MPEFSLSSRTRSLYRACLLLIAVLFAATSGLSGARDEPDRDLRIATINHFFVAMSSDSPPTVEDFHRIFGPHNEDEWTLQLLYDGFSRALTEVPDDETVARVNKRLRSSEDALSLFFCFLRRDRPDLRSTGWTVIHISRREDVGADDFEVQVGEATLLFSFPFEEHYIGRLHDGEGREISSAESFLPYCRPRDCCRKAPP